MKYELRNTVLGVTLSFGPREELPEVAPDAAPTGTGTHYVYVHRDCDGKIFYVGQGCGKRAWSKGRHPIWQQYVDARSGGQFSVQIVAYFETEQEAMEAESEYISKYGPQLVNWINAGREFDLEANRRYWAEKRVNQRFFAETRALESSNPVLAIERYQEAMRRMYQYESIVMERGLVADLNREMGMDEYRGDKKILDRLTLCLWKQGRHRELVESVNEFVKLYPRVWGPMMDGILKRKAKAEALLVSAK